MTRKPLFLVVLLLALAAVLPGCAAFPRAKFELSAFGAALSLDTRTLTDSIGDAAASMTQAVGITAAAPAAPAPEPR